MGAASIAAETSASNSASGLAGCFLARGHQAAGDGVRVAERQSPLARQRVGQFGEGGPAGGRASLQIGGVELRGLEGGGHQGQGAHRIAEHREDHRLQIVLGIHNVAERRIGARW